MTQQTSTPSFGDVLTTDGAQACMIDGRWSPGATGQTITVIDPATEETLIEFPGASVAQADKAVAAARRAFDEGPWPKAAAQDRSLLLHDIADLLEAELDAFADLLVREIGSPTRLVRAVQVQPPIDLLRWFADAAIQGPGQGYEQTLPINLGGANPSGSLLRQEPVGVVTAITPFNFPILQLIRKLGASIASGCTMVVFPSPKAPVSTIAFMRLLERLDLPPGVVSLVCGGVDVARRLTVHPDVSLVSFTGSRTVGAAVMAQAASGIKRVVLELGGKSPNILLPGADIERAIGPSLLRFSMNAGQGCGATTRTFVPTGAYGDYVDAAGDFFADLVVGDPKQEATTIGPLIRAEHRDFVQGHVERAVNGGGVVEAAAPMDATTGFFVPPSLIGGVSNAHPISQEELFGPVGVIIPYNTPEEALAMANDTPYGLSANVWGPTGPAIEFAKRIRSGTVAINGGGALRHDAPWGGFGASGIGREGGDAGLQEFFEVKHIQWAITDADRAPA